MGVSMASGTARFQAAAYKTRITKFQMNATTNPSRGSDMLCYERAATWRPCIDWKLRFKKDELIHALNVALSAPYELRARRLIARVLVTCACHACMRVRN
jgi:hypothetical protein